jgi:hypothetical protein
MIIAGTGWMDQFNGAGFAPMLAARAGSRALLPPSYEATGERECDLPASLAVRKSCVFRTVRSCYVRVVFALSLGLSRGRVFRTAGVYDGGHRHAESAGYRAPACPVSAQAVRLVAPEYAQWAPDGDALGFGVAHELESWSSPRTTARGRTLSSRVLCWLPHDTG